MWTGAGANEGFVVMVAVNARMRINLIFVSAFLLLLLAIRPNDDFCCGLAV